MDCEETYDETSFVAFCQMLIRKGFGITFCPYTMESFWNNSLAALNSSNRGAVKWWNLQCYDGGGGNNPVNWANDIKRTIPEFNTNNFIIAGDWTNSGAEGVVNLMTTFKNENSVGGGFIWALDHIIQSNQANPLEGMKSYANAITAGLYPEFVKSKIAVQ